MGNISGQGAGMQIAVQDTWGIAPETPVQQIEFTSESIKLNKNYIDSDALLGNITTNRMDPAGQKCEGGFGMIVHPDNIGYLLYAALGCESAATQIGSTSGYAHSFSALPCGSAYTLPTLTLVVDRVQAVAAYPSVKVDSMTIAAKVNDYVRADFNVRGIGEASGSTESLPYSALRPFQFIDLVVKVDGSPLADVTDFKFEYKNSLEDNLYTAGTSAEYMREIEPQAREITGTLELLYQDEGDGLREDNFKAGASCSLEFIFTSTEEADTSTFYSMKITIPTAYIVGADVNIGGKDRVKIPISWKAAQATGKEPVEIILVDKLDETYSGA